MSFQATAAPSSRIRKNRRPSAAALLRRSTSSPTAASPRRTPSQPAKTPTSDDDERLNDTGVIATLAADLNFRDVPQYMEYILNRMFSGMPEKVGMNSTRIAQVLNFRKALPPIVTVAHVDALSMSSTKTDREIAEMAQAGVLRRVVIPRRGVGASAVGDALISIKEWRGLVQTHPDLDLSLQGMC
jgi:hypothetical protein